jgi:hypothetical protein
MSVASMPSTTGFKKCQWGVAAWTRGFRGFSGSYGESAGTISWRWTARYELPPMKRSDAAEWIGFLISLNGRSGCFWGYDPGHRTPDGTVNGTPVTHVAANSGTSLMVVGWVPGAGNVLVAGDYIAWQTTDGGRELHKVAANAVASGTNLYNAGVYNNNGYGYGETLLTLAPPIRESPAAGTAIVTQNPACVMQLATDEGGAWDVDEASIYGIRFDALECVETLTQRWNKALSATESPTAATTGAKK